MGQLDTLDKLRSGGALGVGSLGPPSLVDASTDLEQVISAQVQNNGSSGSDTLTFTVPADLANDDYAVLMTLKSDDLNPTFPGESFTQLANQTAFNGAPDRGISIAYKRITDAATEISGSPWTFTTASSKQHIGFLYVVRGVNTSTPIDVNGMGNSASAINPLTTQVLTTTGSNRLGLYFWGGAMTGVATQQVTSNPEGFGNNVYGAAATSTDICFGSAGAILIPSATTTAFGPVQSMGASNSFVTMLGGVALILA